MRLLYSYQEVNHAIKRIFRETAWIQDPDAFVPNSYKTRRRDNIDCPRDIWHFKRSYKMLKCSDVPAASRSFHLEYLHRLLNSRTEHEAMNIPNADAFCVHCTEIASSTHVLNNCILAKMTQKVITEFCKQKGYKHNILADKTYLSFLW